jgi:hypothetical protein
MNAIDLLEQESRLNTLRKHTLRFPSGASLDVYTTPVTLAERRIAGENARSDEQLEINLQLLVLKAKDSHGEPMFNAGHIARLRRTVTAELVAELVGAMYATPEPEDLTNVPAAEVGKSLQTSSGKGTTSASA